eukprot:347723-Chlamydomonas_euryale.AAC.3
MNARARWWPANPVGHCDSVGWQCGLPARRPFPHFPPSYPCAVHLFNLSSLPCTVSSTRCGVHMHPSGQRTLCSGKPCLGCTCSCQGNVPCPPVSHAWGAHAAVRAMHLVLWEAILGVHIQLSGQCTLCSGMPFLGCTCSRQGNAPCAPGSHSWGAHAVVRATLLVLWEAILGVHIQLSGQPCSSTRECGNAGPSSPS